MRLNQVQQQEIRDAVRTVRLLHDTRRSAWDRVVALRAPLRNLQHAAESAERELEQMRQPGAQWSTPERGNRQIAEASEAAVEARRRVATCEAEIREQQQVHDQAAADLGDASPFAEDLVKLIGSEDRYFSELLDFERNGTQFARELPGDPR